MSRADAQRLRHDLKSVVGTAAATYVGNFTSLFALSAAVIPLNIAAGLTEHWAADSSGLGRELLSFLMTVVQLATSLLASAAIISTGASLVAGQRMRFADAYSVAFDRFSTLWWASLRFVFHVLLFALTIVGIPLAIQRAVRWIFFEQAIVLEGTTAKGSLSFSSEVVTGNWWSALTIAVALWAITFVPSLGLGLILWSGPPLIAIVVGPITSAITLPFLVIGLTLLYFELKGRKQDSEPTVAPGFAPA